jgi:hypothetical protein
MTTTLSITRLSGEVLLKRYIGVLNLSLPSHLHGCQMRGSASHVSPLLVQAHQVVSLAKSKVISAR